MRSALVAATILLISGGGGHADSPPDWMVQLSLHGQSIEGRPLAWNPGEVHLLGRDGRLWEFAPQDAKDFRRTSNHFQPYSPSEIRAALLRELGQNFEVSGTEHYLVAHARGQRDQWAERFEDLYRSFHHYFSVRGFQLQKPPFPLIGIVCRNQREFQQYSASQGAPVGNGVVGWYAHQSNRILLYDVGGGTATKRAWDETAATLIHEATHQMAFNTGIHSRYSPPPVWVAEGIATLFEAPGVYDSRYHTTREDRVNKGRLQQFRQLAPKHRPELIRDLVASDRLFGSHPAVAYAEGWALSFLLIETDSRRYAAYLARTSAHAPFQEVTPEERLADFAAVFGNDWRMLEARLLRFHQGSP